MTTNSSAKSILEFLTAPNPQIDDSGAAEGSNTSSIRYYVPMKMKVWSEFNMKTFNSIYGRKLTKELRRKNRRLSYPFIWAEHECVMEDEETTSTFLTRWNQGIISLALYEVRNTLHPSLWSSRKTMLVEVSPTSRDIEPLNKGKKSIKVERPKSRPDAGAISSCEICQKRDARRSNGSIERLPKEIKPGSKWKSAEMEEFIDTNGNWLIGSGRRNEIFPVKQAYTHCVDRGCRYGCILTYHEAFIFRIRPIEKFKNAAKSAGSGTQNSLNSLKHILKRYGEMEYVSVPWENARSPDAKESQDLTVNLSLWLIHVLAGNAHEISWTYSDLSKETLVPQPCVASPEPSQSSDNLVSEPQQSTSPLQHTNYKITATEEKRKKREHDDDDSVLGQPSYSFHESLSEYLPAQPRIIPEYLHNVTDEATDETVVGAGNDEEQLIPDTYTEDTGSQLRRSSRSREKRQRTRE